MTKLLPATLIEGEVELATHRVRQWLDQCRAEDWMDIGISVADPMAGHIQVREILKQLAMSPVDPFKIIEIISWARAGWEDADIAMRELAVELDNIGQELPVALKAYRNELLSPYRQQLPRGHGAQKASHILQDVMVVAFVEKLSAQFPRLAVFSRSPRKSWACICAIVARAFNECALGRVLSAERVHKLHKRFGDDPRHFKHLLVEKIAP